MNQAPRRLLNPLASFRWARTVLIASSLAPLAACGSLMSANPASDHTLAEVAPLDTNGRSGYGAYLAAREAQDNSDEAAAASYYQRALEADPTNGSLAHLTWYYDMAAGQPDAALSMAKRAVALKPDVSLAKTMLAIGDIQHGDYLAAQERVAGLRADGIDIIVLTFVRGWSLVGQGKTDEAAALFKRIGSGPRVDPQVSALADLHEALAYDLGNKPDLAWPAYERTLAVKGDINIRALSAALSFLVRHNRMDDAKAIVGSYRKGHPQSVLSDALEQQLSHTSPTWVVVADAKQGMAESMLGLASSLASANAPETARLFAEIALYLHPNFDFANMLIGDIEQAGNRNGNAVAFYTQVPKDSLISVVVQLHLADSLDAIGKPDQAIALLKALELTSPKSPDVPSQLADTLRRHEKWLEAAAAYRRALYLLGDGGSEQWGIYYSLGDVLYRGHQWPQAELALKRSLELKPDEPEVLNYLGYSWIDRGEKLPEATKMIEKAASLKPSDGYIVDSLGWARYLASDFKGAIASLEHAVELTPADSQINDHLGDAYWMAGRHDEARFQWQRSLGLNPDADEAKDLHRKLSGGAPAAPLVHADTASPS